MNKSELQARMQQLIEERKSHENLYVQTANNINAYNGAIQEVHAWILKLEEAEKMGNDKKSETIEKLVE